MSCNSERPRFTVDANVGRLARWLRMLGYDTLFDSNLDDGELVDISLREGRVLLTRDTRIMLRRVVAGGELRAILIMEDNPLDQMRRVIVEMGLGREREFTRCLECNELLITESREDVTDAVPPYVFKTQEQYQRCPNCRRIYWRGTHWQHMNDALERLMAVRG